MRYTLIKLPLITIIILAAVMLSSCGKINRDLNSETNYTELEEPDNTETGSASDTETFGTEESADVSTEIPGTESETENVEDSGPLTDTGEFGNESNGDYTPRY